MSSAAEESPLRRSRRAAAACEFCRKRKLKCDNANPKCQHCERHNKECSYIHISKKPRPSNARIAQLEEENRLLRRSLMNLGTRVRPNAEVSLDNENPVSLNMRSDNTAPNSPHSEIQPLRRTVVTSPIESVRFSPDRESRYHGPTSALFDEASLQSGQQQHAALIQGENDRKAQDQLLAETARQRQMEEINFMSGKLDFDGEDADLGSHLLSIYWNRQHHFGLIVYQTAFMRDMACSGPYFSKLLLNAMFFSASKNTLRPEVRRDPTNIRTAGYKYRHRFMELLSTEFDKSKITTIQALIIVAGALFTWCDERSTSFLYAGIAFNMIVDLGLHVGTTGKEILSEEDFEVRRRLFWGAFVFDKIHALYQGRPVNLHTAEVDVPLVFLDDFEELEQFRPLSYTDDHKPLKSPVYTLSAFKELCNLSVILDRVLSSFYTQQSAKKTPADLCFELRALSIELENWRRNLPKHLEYKHLESSNRVLLPHMLSHIATFNAVIILLHRPFVSEGHLHATTPSIAYDSFGVCASAAREIHFILTAYGRDFSIAQAPYMISYATYVSATIHVRIAAQREPGSEAHTALQTCLDVLDEQKKILLAPRKAKIIILGLMKRMAVTLGDAEVTSREGMASVPQEDIERSNAAFGDTAMLVSGPDEDVSTHSSYIEHNEMNYQLLDFDMDAILRSFPSEPYIPEFLSDDIHPQSLHDNSQQTSTPVEPYATANTDSRDTPLQPGLQDASMNPARPWAVNNTPMFSDPIFGLSDFALNFGDGQL